MFTRLIASQRRRERSAGATAVSVLAHAAVIGLAVYSTVGAETRARPPMPIERLIWTPVTHPVGGGPKPPATQPCIGCARLPVPHQHLNIAPVDVEPGPPIEQPGSPGDPGDPGDPTGPVSPSPGTGTVDPGAFVEFPDEPARAVAGNPRPNYPSLLRNMHVEGVVSARFVVDTAGRVERASIAFESGGDGLFEESVRRALTASRFVPARTRDHLVRMLVRQDFAFRLTP